MAYVHRWRDPRHSPAHTGIYIHRLGPNRFVITRPLRGRPGQNPPLDILPMPPQERMPTFERALTVARKFRQNYSVLFAWCPIYAFTDVVPEQPSPGFLDPTPASFRFAPQLVDYGEVLPHVRGSEAEPVPPWSVTVGNIGTVYHGSSKDAQAAFDEYVAFSKRDHGRAAGESVVLWRGHDPVKDFEGSIALREYEEEQEREREENNTRLEEEGRA